MTDTMAYDNLKHHVKFIRHSDLSDGIVCHDEMSEKNIKSRLHLTRAESMILYLLLTIMLDMICLKIFGLVAKTDVLSDYKPYGSKILGVILIAEMIVFVKLTPMKIHWSALRFDKEELKRTMPISIAISAGIILVLIGYRVFRTMKDPSLSDIPLFGLYLGTHMRYIYPASCVFQEFFIKAFIQENCGALTGGRDIHYTVWTTSIFFFIL